MNVHQMNLYKESFDKIKNKTKTIELRLNDNKRKNIKKGDILIFKEPETNQTIITFVKEIFKFKSFQELYQKLDLIECGYNVKELNKANYKDMLKYYNVQLEKEFGVLGIKVQLLEVKRPQIQIDSIRNLKDEEITIKLFKVMPPVPSKGYFPAYKYNIYLNKDNSLVGFIDLRIGYNENVFYGGHIGYGIDKLYRGNAYAKKASKLLLEVAKKHQMDILFISADVNNIASRKTIENLDFETLGVFSLPPYNEMYLLGDKKKVIYMKSL